MRVLLAAESYLPYVSGVTVSVDALARGLGARGHEVLVLAPEPGPGSVVEPVGSPGPEPAYAWLPSYQLPAVAPAGYRMPWPLPWTDAMGKARRFAPEIVHANSPFVIGLMARRLAAAVDAPLVFTHHTRFADYGHYLGPLATPGARLTDAYLAAFWRACAAVIAPSEDLAGEIRARLPTGLAGRVRVIPTGVDVTGIRALAPVDPRPVAGWDGDTVVVASLGRLAPEKSPMLALEAVALATREEPAIRLVIIGGGPAELEIRRRAAKADLRERVDTVGALPRIEALARLAGADLFLFTSRTETQGLVLAESLAAGVPAVALSGPGVPDSVRDGIDGVIVDAEPLPTRAERLAAELVRLARDADARREMSERARGGAERFSVERRAADVERLYEELSN